MYFIYNFNSIMAQGVLKGVLSNGIANILEKSLRILDQLLLVPFFLTTWGAEYYGEWLTLSIIPSVLAFSDLGLGSAVCNSFVLAYVSGDKRHAANLRNSGFLVITLSVLLGICLTVCLLLLGDNFHIFDKSVIPAYDAMISVTLMIAARLIYFYSQITEGFFYAARKAAWARLLNSCQHLLNLTVGICVLLNGYGVVAYALSQFITSLSFNIIFYQIGKKQIKLDSSGLILKTDIKLIFTKGIGYLMTPVWQSIYFQGGTFVVRIALGAESVAIFNTIRTVSRSINQLYSIINGSIIPELQYQYGKKNLLVVQKLFRVSVVISMVVGILGVIFLSLFGLDIYRWWTQNILPVSLDVWLVLVSGIFFNSIWWTSSVIYRVTNQPYRFAVVCTLTALGSVLLCYFLSLSFGLLGAVIGLQIFELTMMVYVLPDSCKILQFSVKELFVNFKNDVRYFYHDNRGKC